MRSSLTAAWSFTAISVSAKWIVPFQMVPPVIRVPPFALPGIAIRFALLRAVPVGVVSHEMSRCPLGGFRTSDARMNEE
ncbi:hypothetical protein GHYDROH2_18610 [Geobacter hydrogenophilus]|uniref:Uncharacterized protein n=1 Tax=Geobacter hydrogenophilus TaxID=40983 RepID=A0A9W6G060_9BACT|nr:hypothetical protein GHYDROH2_18610 [Geobacter hydrogenophilus]